jgi:phage tail-like protein
MRGEVDGLRSPRPLFETLPAVYRSDFLAEQMCASFDDLLAPIFATLDCLPAYLDPKTAPADMLDWLAGWIGLTVNAHEEPGRKRELIAAGAALLPWRGTVRSVREAVVAAFNRETEVIESGSATCSTTPDSEPGGQPVPTLIVRVTVANEGDIDRRSLDALVDSVKPAHVPHRVEVNVRAAPVASTGDGRRDQTPTTGGGDGDRTPPSPVGDHGQTPSADGGDGDQTAIIPIVDGDEKPARDAGDGDKPSEG